MAVSERRAREINLLNLEWKHRKADFAENYGNIARRILRRIPN